jgi:hypothetical protein
MPTRFYLKIGKWGSGIGKHSFWDMLVFLLVVVALFLIYLALI